MCVYIFCILYYHKKIKDVDPVDLLNGSVHAPVAAKPLYDELEKIYAYIDNVIRNKGETAVE
jgi:hypothetical protein